MTSYALQMPPRVQHTSRLGQFYLSPCRHLPSRSVSKGISSYRIGGIDDVYQVANLNLCSTKTKPLFSLTFFFFFLVQVKLSSNRQQASCLISNRNSIKIASNQKHCFLTLGKQVQLNQNIFSDKKHFGQKNLVYIYFWIIFR